MVDKPIFEKENVLITGGAGFIGSHLCDELIKKSKVVCIDNYITGQEENIDHLLKNPDFEFIRHDITNPIKLDNLPELDKFKIKFKGIQKIYHLACPTAPREYNRIPIETLLTNSHGTRNILELAVQNKAKFLFLSSSAIYGEPLEEASFKEDYWGFVDPVGPRSCYNEGKRFAESMVMNYHKKYGLEAKILRVFNTFGPRMRLDDGRMIPDFITAALAGRDIEIHSKKDAASTFCYITDLIEAIQRAMRSTYSGVLNIGNPEGLKIVDIAKKIIELTQSTSKIVFKESLPFTTLQGMPDISLAKEKLGWFPVISLAQGLKETISQMKGRSRVVGIENINFNN